MTPEADGREQGPLTLAEIKESARMRETRTTTQDGDTRDNAIGVAGVAALLMMIGWCCGAGVIGAIWAAIG